LKIFITKYKHPNNLTPNYFQVPGVVYLDHLVIEDRYIPEDAFDEYTDEVQERDNPGSFTASNYNLKLSLLVPVLSAAGKTISEFFAPETDNHIPVGYKIAYGENENNIERGDFISPETIKRNLRNDDNGYFISFTVIGAEEMYIRRSEVLQAQTVPESLNNYFVGVFNELLSSSLVFKNIIFNNGTWDRFSSQNIYPKIFHPVYNACVNGFSDQSRWNVFLKFKKEHGIAYSVKHPATCNPAALDSFIFRIFFLSDNQGNQSFKIIEDEDYLITNIIDYSKPNFAIFYVSYTSPQLPSQDWLGSLYISKYENTIGYTALDAGGLIAGNQTNNFYKNYKLDKFFMRNSLAINEDDLISFGTDRVFLGQSGGVNIGVSIGRSLVKEVTRFSVPNIGYIYQDSGFNDIVRLTAAREYPYLVSGISKGFEGTVYFEEGNAPKLWNRFNEDNFTVRIHRVTKRKNYFGTAKINGVII